MFSFFGLGKLAAFLPGGQIVALFTSVAGAIAALVRVVFDSVTAVIANPVVLIVVAVAFGGGFVEGLRWHRHKLEIAHAEIGRIHKSWKSENERHASDIADALVARQKAEDLARSVEAATRDGRVAAERVRIKSAAPAARPVESGWTLPGFPAVLGKN